MFVSVRLSSQKWRWALCCLEFHRARRRYRQNGSRCCKMIQARYRQIDPRKARYFQRPGHPMTLSRRTQVPTASEGSSASRWSLWAPYKQAIAELLALVLTLSHRHLCVCYIHIYRILFLFYFIILFMLLMFFCCGGLQVDLFSEFYFCE